MWIAAKIRGAFLPYSGRYLECTDQQPLQASNLVGGSGHGFGFRHAVANEVAAYTEWCGPEAVHTTLLNNLLCDTADRGGWGGNTPSNHPTKPIPSGNAEVGQSG
jgi:hypothetical protein